MNALNYSTLGLMLAALAAAVVLGSLGRLRWATALAYTSWILSVVSTALFLANLVTWNDLLVFVAFTFVVAGAGWYSVLAIRDGFRLPNRSEEYAEKILAAQSADPAPVLDLKATADDVQRWLQENTPSE